MGGDWDFLYICEVDSFRGLPPKTKSKMRKFEKTIVFTKSPLSGLYKYADIFQIYPANLENLPKSKVQKHFPNILEYWTDSDDKVNIQTEISEFDNLFSESATRIKKQDIITGLLSCFTNNLFFSYKNIEGSWALPISEENLGENANSWSSKWCHPRFDFPKLHEQLIISDFSNVDIKEVEYKKNHANYYLDEPNIDLDDRVAVVFPDTITLMFNSYFALNQKDKEVVGIAISHLISAVELMHYKKTLSLIASFTSLESLIDYEHKKYKDFKPAKCKECGQLQYKVSKKFRGFLLEFVVDSSENKKKFNSYYSLRSKIVHAGKQVKHERLFPEFSTEETEADFITQLEIIQLNRMAVTNWIISKGRNIQKNKS